LPYQAAATAILAGRDNMGTGKMLQGLLSAGDTNLIIFNFDNTFPAINGSRLFLSGVYEANS
jgi:hypothetical protein